jgi:hypothetical protein
MTALRYRAVLFDLDGTLVDSYAALAEAVNYARREHGLPNLANTRIRDFVGEGLERLLERAFDPVNVPGSAQASFEHRYDEICCEESRVLDQAIGLMMYDPVRYAGLGRGASQQYLPPLLSICPQDWPEQRKLEVCEMILASLRGFLIDWLVSGDMTGVEAGFEALARALEREEAAPD